MSSSRVRVEGGLRVLEGECVGTRILCERKGKKGRVGGGEEIK